MKRRPSLIVTVFAVVFLFLDGVLLAWVGIALSNPLLIVLGGAFLVSCLLVIVMYRRYLRSLEELKAAQALLRVEMEHMLQTVRDGGASGSDVSSLLES